MRRCEVCGTVTSALMCPRDGEPTMEHQLGPAHEAGHQSQFATTEVFGPTQQKTKRASSANPPVTKQTTQPMGPKADSGATSPAAAPPQPAAAAAPPGAKESSGSKLYDPPSDLPRVWDAPAPKDGRSIMRSTLHMHVDEADESVVDPVRPIETDPLDELLGSYTNDVPEEPVLVPDSTEVSTPSRSSLARRSGGWGDELFGDIGRKTDAPHETHAAESLGPEVEESNETKLEFNLPRVEEPPPERPRWLTPPMVGVALLAAYGLWMLMTPRAEAPKPAVTPQKVTALGRQAPKPKSVPEKKPAAATQEAPTLDEEADGDRPLLAFRARLGKQDHLDAHGHPLKVAWRVLARDRERVHAGSGESEDVKDETYGTAEARARFVALLKRRRLPTEVQHAIMGGTPLVEVRVWAEQVTVELLKE